MADTTLRYLETLRAIPRHPRKTTPADVHRCLIAAGYVIDRRSVERDLHRLSQRFAIACDEGTRPAGWFWREHAAGLMAPGATTVEALELELLARYLKPLLPTASWAALEPRLAAARASLDTLASAPLARWRKRVAAIDDGQPLLAPQIPYEVLEAVHEALLRNQRLEIDYRAIDSDAERRYEIHPAALVYQGRVGYLVALVLDYTDLRLLALHRMSAPKVLPRPARQAPNFDLSHYLRQQLDFGLPSGRELRLQLRASGWLVRHLSERRLAEDQTISKPDADGRSTVRATVPESERLIRWLRSHGDAVEVLKPASLRKRLKEEFGRLAVQYRDST